MAHFIDDRDLSRDQLLDILETTWKLKHEGHDLGRPLAGKNLALVMTKPSLRTRTSFTVATRRLGGDVIEIGAHNTKLGKGEDMEEWAAVLGRMVDAIGARVHGHQDLFDLRDHSGRPVINLLSDFNHPLQGVCDAYTAWEFVKKTGVPKAQSAKAYFETQPKWAWLGDGNNVAHTLMLTAANLGARLSLAVPEGYDPDPDVVKAARALHPAGDEGIEITRDADAAVKDAEVVHTDTWVSMGQESDRAGLSVEDIFGPFQVDQKRLAKAQPGAAFMHCLPAVPGQEMTAEVLRGPQSIVIDQAENRLWTVQTLLARWVFA